MRRREQSGEATPVGSGAFQARQCAPEPVAQRRDDGYLVRAEIGLARREDQLAPSRRQEGCGRPLGEPVSTRRPEQTHSGQHGIVRRAGATPSWSGSSTG